MEIQEREESKARIVRASIQLFSSKGYDAASINEIAEAAEVNKALIYYYFKSKEGILDHLISSLMDDFSAIAMQFVNTSIVKMIKDGRLDIEADRMRFSSQEAIAFFIESCHTFYTRVFDYMLEQRSIIRIMMLESLKNGKHHNALFRFLALLQGSMENPLFKTIWEADRDLQYSQNTVLFKFFFSLIPLVSTAVYYDDYRKMTGMGEQQFREGLTHAYSILIKSVVSGTEILFQDQVTDGK